MTGAQGAAAHYAARVDAVLAQRTRLRGPEPQVDLWSDDRPDSPLRPLLQVDALRPLDANLEVIASYVESTDVVVDVGGGAGRISLPLARICKRLVNVEPSTGFCKAFLENARRAGLSNVEVVTASWPQVDSVPLGTLALVNHVLYATRDIVPFLQKLEEAGPRRVLITVNSPVPPSWQRRIFEGVHGEPEEVMPGHVELVNVLWEMGVLPDVRVLPTHTARPVVAEPTRDAAVARAVAAFGGEQWALWPLGAPLEDRVRSFLLTNFESLFVESDAGYEPRWIVPGREILITWRPRMDVEQ